MIRISIVNYLNSIPFLKGLTGYKFSHPVEIMKDSPSECARKISDGDADIGLIPVASISKIPQAKIISDFCIAADGPVSSVILASQKPLHEINEILLDYQSQTSVLLTRILAKKFWKINPRWINTGEGYESEISGDKAGVIIGDRAMQMKNSFQYVYDLSQEWKKFTDMPFVFACWVSNAELNEKFISEFNDALFSGLNEIENIIEGESDPDKKEDLRKYFTENILFTLDDRKRSAMRYFQELAEELD